MISLTSTALSMQQHNYSGILIWWMPTDWIKEGPSVHLSLWPGGPKFEIRSTHARTNLHPNNAFPCSVRRHISKVFIAKNGRNGPNWCFSISHVMSMEKNQPQIDVFQHPLYKKWWKINAQLLSWKLLTQLSW